MRKDILDRRGEGAASVVAIVAILVIVVLAVYFIFFRGRAATSPTTGNTTDINVQLPDVGGTSTDYTPPGTR